MFANAINSGGFAISGINLNANAFYKFCRACVIDQMVAYQEQQVQITAESDKRYRPICHRCKKPAGGIPALISFAKMIIRHFYGITNHSRYTINASWLDGINNKIRICERKTFSFHDEGFLSYH